MALCGESRVVSAQGCGDKAGSASKSQLSRVPLWRVEHPQKQGPAWLLPMKHRWRLRNLRPQRSAKKKGRPAVHLAHEGPHLFTFPYTIVAPLGLLSTSFGLKVRHINVFQGIFQQPMTLHIAGCGSQSAASRLADQPLLEQPQPGPSNVPDSSVHRCPYEGCGKSYTKASKLAQHVRSHTGERPFVCDHDGCGASYMRNEHLKAHQRRHQDPSEKAFACQEEGCELRFWTTSQLKNHVQACHADHLSTATGASAHDYPCTEPGCEQTFHKRKQLRQHIRDQHAGHSQTEATDRHEGVSSNVEQSPSALPFVCPYPDCGKRFASNSKRKTHARTHQDGRYTCTMQHACPQSQENGDHASLVYTFPTWSALQAHMKEAHPPVCPWPGCEKVFQRQDNLRAHYRRHENRKLRLELEAKVLEGSHEAELNHLRAELSDDSGSSSFEEEEEEQEPHHTRDQPLSIHSIAPNISQHASPVASDEDLVNRAAHLGSTRPRRGGVFRDLSSPALSIITSASGGTGSVRPGSVATSLTSARDPSASSFACTWNGCGKIFTRKNTLSIHVRTAHLGERPFECPDCGRRFAHKHLVSRHRRVCTGTRSSPEQMTDTRSRLRFSTSGNASHDEAENQASSSEASYKTSDSAGESEAQLEDSQERDSEPVNSNASTTGLSSSIKPRLLDLLTGRGYSSVKPANQQVGSGKRPSLENGNAKTPAKRRRTTRDRIFACPWTSICHELDEQMLDPALRTTGAGSPSTAAATLSDACEHRFKRLYDLRRHLRAQHGLDLTADELSAIIDRTPWASVQ